MKWIVNGALAILLLFDVALGLQIHRHGPPTAAIWSEVRPGVDAIRVTRVPFTLTDWGILGGLVAMHVLLIYLVWRFHRKRIT